MQIRTQNQADIMIVNALNNMELMLSEFRFTTDQTRKEIVVALEVCVQELNAATNYKAGA
jgi:hypothetical protein